jgi:ectoine hydroxylase-related dioxygenase (phytanoyl-CoA dioxygenase family)
VADLTAEQLAFFQSNGYLVLERVLADDAVAALQAEADYLLELMINSSLAHGRRSGRLDWLLTSAGRQVVRKIQPVNDLSLAFTRAAEDPRLIGPLRELMADMPVLLEEKPNYKQPLPTAVAGLPIPEADDAFPVHNDWAYYKAQGYPQSILSSALLLDDCTAENGPLRVWPGSHTTHLEHQPAEPRGLEVKPDLIDHGGGIDVLAPAGSFLIFHVLLVHNSRPNTSAGPRRLMIYSHHPQAVSMPADVRNGPARLRESPWEREYMRMRLRGDYTDTFGLS